MRFIIVFMGFFSFFSFSQTLDSYVSDDRRPSPVEFLTVDDLKKDKEYKNNEENKLKIEKLLEKFNLTNEQIQERIKELDDYQKEADRLEHMLKSTGLNTKGFFILPRFFFRKSNKITCNGIEINDAAQLFKDGKTYLYLKFRKKTGSGQRIIPKLFLNQDMRRSFAIHTKQNEVAFYRPLNLKKKMRMIAGDDFVAGYTIALDGRQPLSDISCAKRRMKKHLLTPSGQYKSIPDNR